PDRHIAWGISGLIQPPIGHIYGYTLEPLDTTIAADTDSDTGPSTLVTSYYDWSDIDPVWRERNIFPIIPESALRATLGILERTVLRGGYPAPR
ncbi:MAG TPA: hypothetical protein VHQ23_19420, partial [Ilumatobacteraceae bacterium]|nr:hypothetical protein [Ilumatobacteraceae bacterium]